MNPLVHPELHPFVERAKKVPVCETVAEMRQAWRAACLWRGYSRS